ncbi:MAG: hypothetical protein OEV40_05095 [Acidimicrobiia bacterium]|nr:hypothetical protein [Acidimicrobiia bacterium]
MSDPSLQVDLESGIAEVGGRFRGRLRRAGELDDLAGDDDQPVRAVRLTLRYVTEGRGDTDSQVIGQLEFPVDTYGRLDTDFQLPVPPAGPISYDGRLIRVLWELEARVDVKLRRDRSTSIPLLVIPTNGWGLYHRPHPLRR